MTANEESHTFTHKGSFKHFLLLSEVSVMTFIYGKPYFTNDNTRGVHSLSEILNQILS